MRGNKQMLNAKIFKIFAVNLFIKLNIINKYLKNNSHQYSCSKIVSYELCVLLFIF